MSGFERGQWILVKSKDYYSYDKWVVVEYIAENESEVFVLGGSFQKKAIQAHSLQRE